MLIIKRLFVYLLPLVILILFLLLLIKANWFFYVLLLIILLIIFSCWYIISQKTTLAEFLFLLSSPIFLIASSFIFFTFLELIYFKVIIILSIPLLIFLYFNKIFQEFYKKPLRQIEELKNLFSLFQILSLWFFASSLYGLIIFINLSVFLALGILIGISLLFLGQLQWLNSLIFNVPTLSPTAHLNFLTGLVFLIIFSELALILKILPLTFYFKGFGYTAMYYLLTQGFLLSLDPQLKIKKFYFREIIIINCLIFLTLVISYLINR